MNTFVLKSEPLLSLSREELAYKGQVALQEVSLSVSRGEKVALIGKSGAGKTTLLRRLYQLNPQLCAFIHQHHALVPQLTVFHNIYMGRLDEHSLFENVRNLISPQKKYLDKIERVVLKLGLEDKLFTRVGELSGGQQQRVGVGRALYRGGSILMADEPVSSLDIKQSEDIMRLIVNSGETVVSSLHSVDFSKRFFNRIIGLKGCRVLFDLPVAAVSENHLADLYN